MTACKAYRITGMHIIILGSIGEGRGGEVDTGKCALKKLPYNSY